MRFTKYSLVFLLLPLLLVASCSKGKDETPVAKVNDRMISLADFETYYTSVDPKFLPEEGGLEGLKLFLETMINKEVLAIKADELGYDKDQSVQEGLLAFKQVGLQAGYMKFKVADKINVTEEDVKKGYEFYGKTYRCKQVQLDTLAEAEEVYDLLTSGSDFESVCRQYSKAPDAQEGGKIIEAMWGTFQPHFNDGLFSTPIGGITRPLLERPGYFVVKILEEVPKKKKPYEDVKHSVRKILEKQEQLRLTAELTDAVRAKHGFKWYEDTIKLAFDYLPTDISLYKPPSRNDEVYPLMKIPPADLDKPLVEYDDKFFTLRDFSDLYDRMTFYQRPRREFRTGDIKKMCLDVVMNDIVEVELRDSKIEEEPAVADMLRRKREQLMVNKMYEDLVEKQTIITREEMNNYYQDNLDRFRTSESRRFGMILTGSKEEATDAYNKVMNGEDFQRVLKEYSIESPQDHRRNANFITRGDQPDIDEIGFGMLEGAVAKPFETSKGWMVLKLNEVRPERVLSINEARSQITEYLKSLKTDEKLNNLLAKWKSEMTIEVFENNLEKANTEREQEKPFSFG